MFRQNIIALIEKKCPTIDATVAEQELYEYATTKSESVELTNLCKQIYIDKLRSVFANYSPTHPTIKTAKQWIHATHQEMNPDKWKKTMDKIALHTSMQFETNLSAATDTFICRKCKKKECTYYQLQTRSADEPMTTFVNCLSCGFRWKC